MWVYLGDVIDENCFHNCVGTPKKLIRESPFSFSVSKRNTDSKQNSYLIIQ